LLFVGYTIFISFENPCGKIGDTTYNTKSHPKPLRRYEMIYCSNPYEKTINILKFKMEEVFHTALS
jgi:hypothetical protein